MGEKLPEYFYISDVISSYVGQTGGEKMRKFYYDCDGDDCDKSAKEKLGDGWITLHGMPSITIVANGRSEALNIGSREGNDTHYHNQTCFFNKIKRLIKEARGGRDLSL